MAHALGAESMLLGPAEGGELAVLGAWPPEKALLVRNMSAALWTWGRAEPAGRGTDTLPAARWAFVPVRPGEATLAALGASPGDEDLAPTDLSLLALSPTEWAWRWRASWRAHAWPPRPSGCARRFSTP